MLVALAFLAALGAGLMAGTFYAFSVFVMTALRRIPPASGIAAMQAINVAVITPPFLSVFVGTALLSAAAIAFALLRWSFPASALLLAGGGLYLIGTFLVTFRFNVPLNNTLGGVVPSDPDAPACWEHYASRWTVWNHVRTAAALAALGAFIAAIVA